MTMDSPAQSPLDAPLWRKLLAVRVLLVSVAAVAVSISLIGWFDSAKPDVPRWLQKGVVFLAFIPFLTLFVLVIQGITDMAVHFIPEGKVKRLLVGTGKSSAEMAREFAESGYVFALLPFIIWALLAGLLLGLLLIFGGFALVSSLFSSLFAGWPPWAVVITILLVLILAKK
jgi:hypothetical protein